jgi:hypothetical protein
MGITEHLCESLCSIPRLICRQLEVQAFARQRSHQVTQYHYTEWPDFFFKTHVSFETINKLKLSFECGIPRPSLSTVLTRRQTQDTGSD